MAAESYIPINRVPMTHAQAGHLGGMKVREQFINLVRQQQEEARSRWVALGLKCHECNQPISYEGRKNRFCGSSCAAIFNNRKRKPIRFCGFCGIGLNYPQVKFCSKAHVHAFYWALTKKKIEETGVAPTDYMARKFLLEKNGHVCQICKGTEWREQPIPLVLDHINGNPVSLKITDLRLICGNCDMQTPTYKGRNLGRGRFARRQRYQEGKSY